MCLCLCVWGGVGCKCVSVSLVNQTLPSAALDVLHHQHAEGRVWPLLHGFRGTGWNVDITNEISARVIMNNLNVPGMGDQSGVNINWRCLE